MQLIFAATVAVVLGLAVHAVLPDRAENGLLLLPAVAGVACAITWTALTWLGVPDGSGGLWVAAILAAVVAPVAIGLPLRRSRLASDRARLSALAR